MPRFALTFEYPDRLGAKVVDSQTVTRDSIEAAAEYVATQRRLTSIHIRTCNGEDVDRLFTFGPSGKAEAA